MDVRAFGEQGLLLECEGPDAVRAAYAEVLRRRDAGDLSCTDIVPGAGTVLLDGVTDPGGVRDRLAGWSLDLPDRAEDSDGELVELPVTYDGPDLEWVAEHCGMDVGELVRRHRETEFVVAFCGFAPGFAYLSGLPEELYVPRREDPRSRVPAGSVGLAGPFTGVYPRSSPGGWQLIARTDAPLWDLDRDPPALLAPGVRVRFVEDGSSGS